MKKDYHTHPNIINNPNQAEKFIKKATELEFDEICFTDHMPFSLTPNEFDRIPRNKVGQYCEIVKSLAEKYKNDIIIKAGIEADYHPNYEDEIKNVLAQGEFDYVIGSSHLNIAGYGIDMKNTSKTEFANMVINNYISAAKSGLFNTISHLDVYRWVFSAFPLTGKFNLIECTDNLNKLFYVLQNTGVNLELNAAPLYKKFDNLGFYPQKEILDIAKNYNIKYIYGSDAHIPQNVGFGYDKIKEFGLF